MKKIFETGERTWYLVKEWTTDAGLEARVCQCVWSDKVSSIESSLHPFYTGYVQVPEDKKVDVDEIKVHGGVTFGPKPLDMEGASGNWIGFDMAHLGDESQQDLDYAIGECEHMAKQLMS